jgi:hypothetical protein
MSLTASQSASNVRSSALHGPSLSSQRPVGSGSNRGCKQAGTETRRRVAPAIGQPCHSLITDHTSLKPHEANFRSNALILPEVSHRRGETLPFRPADCSAGTPTSSVGTVMATASRSSLESDVCQLSSERSRPQAFGDRIDRCDIPLDWRFMQFIKDIFLAY